MSFAQEEAIATIVRLMRTQAERHPATLFVMGSYRIGKERAYLGAAKALGWQVYVNADKLRVNTLAAVLHLLYSPLHLAVQPCACCWVVIDPPVVMSVSLSMFMSTCLTPLASRHF